MSQEREGNAAEIRSTAKTSYDNIRILPCKRHLFLCLKTDHCLMKGHMVHYRTKCILAGRCHPCQLYSL